MEEEKKEIIEEVKEDEVVRGEEVSGTEPEKAEDAGEVKEEKGE